MSSHHQQAVLHLVCGSHYAQQPHAEQPRPATLHIARRFKAELVFQPDWQSHLCGCDCLASTHIQNAIETQIMERIVLGHSVVLDIPANTPQLRQWLKTLIEKSGSRHLLHYLVSSAPLHKQTQRNAEIENQLQTDFIPPKVEEGFNVEVSPYSGTA